VFTSWHRRVSLPHESLCSVCGDCNLIGLRPEEVPRLPARQEEPLGNECSNSW
jgi:hypothetical protein